MKLWIFLSGWLLSVGVQATDVFIFTGFTFDQRNGPETAQLFGNALTNGSAIFSAGAPRVTTSSLNFPQDGTGFQTNRSLGMLAGLATNGTRAVNLPDGNLGSAIRHGIELGWPTNYGAPNATGSDFVILTTRLTSQIWACPRWRWWTWCRWRT